MARLDVFLVENCGVETRSKAQQLIKNGDVLVCDKVVTKSAFDVNENDKIEILNTDNYVSRGAYKLLGAISEFKLDFLNKIVLDVGSSTGGFTQVSLKNGAKKVYAVDVGRGELHKSLRQDNHVVVLEEQDIRTLEKDKVSDVNIVVGDVSFISLQKVVPKIVDLFGVGQEMMFLFKPQFECGKTLAKKYKGVIKDKQAHKNLLREFELFLKDLGLRVSDICVSPIRGGDGNIEYLVHINGKENTTFSINEIVESAFLK